MSYYLKCGKCGRVVSSAAPGGAERVTLRAIVECPECIAAAPDVELRIAEAVAAEQKECAKVAKEAMEDMKEYEQNPNPADPYGEDQARGGWLTARAIYEGIRARAGEGEQVPMSDNGTCAT